MPAESRRAAATQSPIIPVIADLIRRHPGTISLGQGVVGYGPPPAATAHLVRALADPTLHKYQPVAGIPALLDAIAQKLTADHAVPTGEAHGNRIMVTAGGNQAFMNAVLALADPGDEFIVPTPYYFNHEMAVTLADCRPVLVPTDADYQLDLAALRAAITPRTRAILTVSPNNPTGAVYPEKTLRAVNALCAEHGIYHVHDEAYAAFTHDGAAHFSPASIPGAAAHTLSLHSLSKSHGFAGWRIGWMVYPAHLESALRKIQDTLVICPPAISQFAALGALDANAGGGTPYVRAQLRALAAVRTVVRRELAPLVAGGLAEIPPADGAFYFLPRLRSALPPFVVAEKLIREHGVAVIPGSAFGFTPADGCHLRVAYGSLTESTAAEGIGRLVHGLRAIIHA
ncbi:MAG: pyridoxal phosphate-dependent aminotransferase [Undibacterium sp.]|nr:pyridoxal phosphate-dependent aminotransferase [Opitutaceae bacterium]